ncbi:MAG TPA: ubiquinone biosynthesis protein UbiE, partial [Blastocatellia bacterium]|nr:ubiquinone biosynthesis protein UbiE [Blastocatellia bacterium]
KRHRNIIHSRFKEIYQRKRIICLYIPDEFEFMDPELVTLLEEKVTPYLTASSRENMVDS